MKPAFPKVESRVQQLAQQFSPLILQRVRHYIAVNSKKDHKILLKHLIGMKKKGESISMITAYDYNQGKLADISGIDMILVGDSCANVMMGLTNTNQISMDAIVHHTRSVSNGISTSYLVGDMPFGSYLTADDAVRNACRIIGEGGASAVKLEGFIPEAIESISKFVPVIGHLGLLPQTADCFGTRGRTFKDILRLKEESLRLQDAGCSLLVLEKVCAETSKYISDLLDIPTIGIASGVHCDGQVLVWHDLLGLNNNNDNSISSSPPSSSIIDVFGGIGNGISSGIGSTSDASYKFVKQYANLSPIIINAIKEYIKDVKSKKFPQSKHSFYLSNKTREKLADKICNDYEKEISRNEEDSDNGSDSESDIMSGFPNIQGNLIDPTKFWNEFAQYDTRSQMEEDYNYLSSKLNVKISKCENSVDNKILIIENGKELRQYRSKLEKEGKNVIFVPFLGGLHEGHLKLIKEAKKRRDQLFNDFGIKSEIIVSLFLNPTQFNNECDLKNYPMVIEEDLKAIKNLECVNVIFKPKYKDMYNVNDSHFRPFINFKNIYDKCEEAKQREGHFEGVGTVVAKFFAWIRPQIAIFGQKDFMQSILVQRLCDEFFPDTEIVVHETVRDENGLALSSRNRKLNSLEIDRAPMMYECLCTLVGIIFEHSKLLSSINGNKGNIKLRVCDLKVFGQSYCIEKGVNLEYISLHEFDTGLTLSDDFDILKNFANEKYVISIAGSVGPSTRLIDNIVIGNDCNENKIPLLNDILSNVPAYSTFYTNIKKMCQTGSFTHSTTVACILENDAMALKAC